MFRIRARITAGAPNDDRRIQQSISNDYTEQPSNTTSTSMAQKNIVRLMISGPVAMLPGEYHYRYMLWNKSKVKAGCCKL